MPTTTRDPLPVEVRRGATPKGGPLTLRGQHWPAPPGAPTALMLPGGGQTHASWYRTARSLTAAGLGALLVDLRGHGSSDWSPDAAYGLDAFVEDLLAVCATPDRPPVIVGASLRGLGGLVAPPTVGENPGCASGLVMVDIAIDNREAGIGRVRDFLAGTGTGSSPERAG